MGWIGKRLIELEKRQECILIQLKRLDEIVTKRVVMRELTDVKIRIRNLQKNYKKDLDWKCVVAEKDTITIAVEDDDFDPTLVELNTTRPQMRVYPKIPLPHSQPLWPRIARVARGWPDFPLAKQLGQFTGVEEEDERWQQQQWQGGNSQNLQRFGASVSSSTMTEVNEISQSVEDIRAENLTVPHSDDGGSRIDSRGLNKMKIAFSLDKIAASGDQSPCCSEITPDSSGEGEDLLEREKDGEVFTKIRCRVDEKSINKIKALVTQNNKDNTKSFLKQNGSIPCQSGSRSVTVVQRIFKSEVGYNTGQQQEEENTLRTPGPESSANIVTVRARLAPHIPSHSNVKLTAVNSDSGKESSKKRLTSKVDG